MFPFPRSRPLRARRALRARGPRRALRWAPLCLAPALLLQGACRSPAGDRPLAVWARYGKDSAPELFASSLLARESTRERLPPTELVRRCAEISGAFATPLAADGTLPEKFLLRCSLDGLQAPVSALEVDLLGANGGALRCRWGDTPGIPGAEAAGELAQPDRRSDGSSSYRCARPDREAKAGEGWIFLGAETRAADRPRLRALRTVTSMADPALAERVAARRWTIALGAEWRDGLPALPGHPAHWRVRLPPGARLRFGYASGTLPHPRFRVRVHPAEAGDTPDGTDGAHGGHPPPTAQAADGELLFASPEAAPGERGESWREAEVDLARWADREVDLRFEVEAEGAPWDAWGAWGSPLLVAPAAAPKRPHVLLISIDTLRADHLSAYGAQRATSPALDAWAAHSAILFERAYSQAPWTLPSHVSLLTGLEPFRHGVELDTQAPRYRSLSNLATALAAAGYLTEAVTGGGFVHPRFGFSRGFDRYRFWPPDQNADDELASGIDQALRLFDGAARSNGSAGSDGSDGSSGPPRFLFLHTYEVHPPNRARQPYFGRWSALPSDLEVAGAPGTPTVENGFVGQPSLQVHRQRTAPLEPLPPDLEKLPADLYDSAIGYLDEELRRLFEGLRERGVLDHALVVVTSDHGEALGEWGRWNHGHLDTANLHIPLLVALPDRRGAGTRIATQVRSIDIAPTILEAVGAAPLPDIDGRSLFELISGHGAPKDRPVWSYGSSNNRGLALRSTGDLALQFQDSAFPPIAGRSTAFDLAADPGELQDVAESRGSKVAAFRAAIARLWAAELPAVRVEFVNGGNRRWRGLLRSPLIEATTVKSFDVANGDWTWAGRGKSAFEVAPGRRFSVLLQDRGRTLEPMAGEIEIEGCAGVRRFELVASAVAQSIEVDAASCRVAPPAAGSVAAGIGFRRQGMNAGDATSDRAGEDAILREQLRALGYF